MASISYAKPSGSGDALGFESHLWAAADKMRGHMDASEYKHVCLGLIFLKYISETLETQFAESAKLEKAIRQNLKTLSHA